jgi:hypothetical protein
MDYAAVTRYVAFGLIVAFLLGLGGWYMFLSNRALPFTNLAGERGLGENIPAFSGFGGSTFENIVSGLGFREETPDEEGGTAPRLWQVQATPAAGLGFLAGATSSTLRLMERSTGHIFEADPRSGAVKRVTNTLIPKVHEASFAGDGSVIGSMMNDAGAKTVFTATLTRASSTDAFSSLQETSLGEQILDIVPSRAQRTFVSLVPDSEGAVVIRSEWNGTRPQRVFTSGLSDWHLHLLTDDSLVLVQKAASGVPGSAYRVTGNGSLSPLARGIDGLTILPRANSEFALIGADNGVISLSLQTATSSLVLPLRTMADKCVWAPGANPIAYCAVPSTITSTRFLDEWYRGLIHTSDSWWKVDAAAGTTELLFTPGTEGRTLDVENPVINDTGEYLAFMNARDKSAWILRIAE